MAKKKSKLSTPAWITEGYDSPAEYEKAKGRSSAYPKTLNEGAKPKKKVKGTFSIKICPKCKSDDVGVVIGEIGNWECHKCKWKGEEIVEEELTENEFMKYLDEQDAKEVKGGKK